MRYCHFGVSPVNYSDSDSESKDDLFIGTINKSDIIGLAEVKCDLNKVQFDNFVAHYVERKFKKRKPTLWWVSMVRHSCKENYPERC